jgi:hypothetical protein
MPDKNYSSQNHKKGCGNECLRCWRNKLKHGNKLKKKNFPKLFIKEKEEEETNERIYNSNMEEFIEKYIKYVNNNEKKREINDAYNTPARSSHANSRYYKTMYNDYLISETAAAYNEWIFKDKNIRKKIKDKNLIELMDKALSKSENRYPRGPCYTEQYYPDYYVDEGFYMFECVY